MKILVLLKVVHDARVPLGYSGLSGTLKPDWNVPVLNPADISAVAAALNIRDSLPGTHITLVHLGPPSGERFIREMLALGCDDGVRIWDENLDQLPPQGKALILARAANILGFDIVFAGARSEDSGSAQLGIQIAFHLQTACISRVTAINQLQDGRAIATRRLERGFSERIEAPLPLVLTVEAQTELNRYASFPALLAATKRKIPCLDLADMGIPRETVRHIRPGLNYGPLHFPESRQRFIPAPDPALPVFDRIQKLLQGTMARREGKVVSGQDDFVVEEIFQTLLQEGWLNHLQKSTTSH